MELASFLENEVARITQHFDKVQNKMLEFILRLSYYGGHAVA
jgi:hypothetical protein